MKALFLILCLAFATLPGDALADTFRDRVVEELTDDGFTQIRISRTLLGRTRFLATKPGARREIVMNPATGLILRDYLQIFGDRGSSGSGSGYDDDDDDDDHDNSGRGSYDDDDDDDDREDNSGPGSADDDDKEDNSGSGSSNSGSGSDDEKDDD